MASEIISAENFPPSNIVELTSMTADAAVGVNEVHVANIAGASSDDYLLIGDPAVENTELMQLDSIDDDKFIFTSTTRNAHLRSTRIYLIRANQIKSYRALNVDGTRPANGSFSNTGTHNILVDSLTTEYVETLGGSGYWFLYTLYNETTMEETSMDDAVARRGGGTVSYTSVDLVRERAGLKNNRYISDAKILRHLLSAIAEVNGSLAIGGYTLPLDEVPNDVVNATELLAAGYLLADSYGPQHEGLSKDAQLKIKMAKDILGKIEMGEQTLVGEDGTQLSNSGSVRGYPDDNAAGNNQGHMFTVNSTNKDWR